MKLFLGDEMRGLAKKVSMAAALALATVSLGDSVAASPWSGSATEWTDLIKKASAECVQQCVVDTKGNVTSSGLVDCVKKCSGRLKLAGKIGSIASGATGLLRYAPWVLSRLSEGRRLERFMAPKCVVWAHSAGRARWEAVTTGVSIALSALSFGSLFASGDVIDAIKCVGCATSLWNFGVFINEIITTWSYRCKNPTKKTDILDSVLIKMEQSLGVGENIYKNDKHVTWEVFNSLQEELAALREDPQVDAGQNDRLRAVKQKLEAWRGV